MFCQGFSIHVYPGRHCGSCFICMSVIFIVPVDVLPPWMPGHLQTQCWSPNWLMFCQGFSIHVYLGRHCGSCFICMSVIFIVPVDVLPYGCQAICRHSADHPNGQCFDKVSVSACTLEDIVVPVLFVWVWSSLCLLMPCLHGCQAICRHSADHPNRQCFDKVSVSVRTLEDIVVPVLFVWVWSSLSLLMSCLRGCQAICRHSAGHPIWIMICQVFSIRMYFGRHCGSCFMLMNVIFTVPVDVLPPWMPGHLQTQCW